MIVRKINLKWRNFVLIINNYFNWGMARGLLIWKWYKPISECWAPIRNLIVDVMCNGSWVLTKSDDLTNALYILIYGHTIRRSFPTLFYFFPPSIMDRCRLGTLWCNKCQCFLVNNSDSGASFPGSLKNHTEIDLLIVYTNFMLGVCAVLYVESQVWGTQNVSC